MHEELPAVTVPVGEKTGRNLESASTEQSWRTPSSTDTTPLTPLTLLTPLLSLSLCIKCIKQSMGTTSSLSRPLLAAFNASRCDRTAYASCAARVILYSLAIPSARHAPNRLFITGEQDGIKSLDNSFQTACCAAEFLLETDRGSQREDISRDSPNRATVDGENVAGSPRTVDKFSNRYSH